MRRVYGILNGTCNYILTKMQDEHRAFADVLKEAQAKGYAEADPTFDIGGFDTAHKLALLTSLAFGTRVAFDEIDVEGIEGITQADIEAAEDLGYRIKLLGVALLTESGIEQRVHPAMVPQHSAIAEVSGVTNCVAVDGDFVGNLLLVGPRRRGGRHGLGRDERHPRHRARRQVAIRSACRPRSSSPTSGPGSGGTRAPTTCACRCTTGRAPWPASPGAWASESVSLESIVQRRPRGAQIGINARRRARRADAGHPDHARDHRGGHPPRRWRPSTATATCPRSRR